MNKNRLRGIISVLERYGTEQEKHFVQSAEEHFNQEGRLTEQRELVLESLLRGKIRRMRNAMLSMKANRNSMKQLQ